MHGRSETHGMRAVAAVFVALALGACRDAPSPVESPPDESARPQAPAAPSAPATIRGTAAPVIADGERVKKDDRLDGMRAGLRQAHFESQLAVPLPADAPAEIHRLVPESAKLVEFEIHRRMHLLAPTTRRRVVLRWLTRLEGELARALARRAAGMWVGAPVGEGVSTVEHPRWGTLRWTVHTPAERATRVEMVLEADEPEAAPPLPAIEGAPWRDALADGKIMGFEHGRYHAHRGAGSYTDLERLSAIVQTDDPTGMQLGVEKALLAAGYKQDDDDPRLLRAPGVARTTFTARPGEGQLTVHHQRRWTRRSEKPDGSAEPPRSKGR